MADQVWLALDETVSVGIDRDEALSLDRKGFAKLYRKTMWGSSQREANAWADKQIADRAAAVGGTATPEPAP
jgi:hypothetical protein